MKTNTLLLMAIFLFILFSNTFEFDYVNTIQTQRRAKERARKMKGKIISKNKKWPKSTVPQIINKTKRKLEDDDYEEITFTYNRCDHGHTPDDLSDCTKYKTNSSACCMFKYGVDTGCVLIGFQYLGTKTIGDMKVECVQRFLNIPLNKIFILLLGLFLL